MAKIDAARRAAIGRAKRARTRAQILEAAAMLLTERPVALTVDAIVQAAGVAKGTFYYHFQGLDDLSAALGATLGASFDDLLTSDRLDLPDAVARLSFAFTQFLEKAISDPLWARLMIQSSKDPAGFARGIRAHLRDDLANAIEEGGLIVQDVELAADIVIGIWLQVVRGSLERRTASDLPAQALRAVLRAVGAAQPRAE
jgi:AcrR family transcriptional regulator